MPGVGECDPGLGIERLVRLSPSEAEKRLESA